MVEQAIVRATGDQNLLLRGTSTPANNGFARRQLRETPRPTGSHDETEDKYHTKLLFKEKFKNFIDGLTLLCVSSAK